MIFFKSLKKKIAGLFQTKSVTASTSSIIVTPDNGYDGLSEVIVSPTPSSSVTVTAEATTNIVEPPQNKLLSEVIINPQVHSDDYPSSSSYYYVNAGSSATIDLGSNHNYRNIRAYMYNGSSSTSYYTISNLVTYYRWKYNDSAYNNQTVNITINGSLTISRANYILLVYGRNNINCDDVYVSYVSTGSYTTIKSDYDTYDSAADCYTAFKLYKWTASNNSGTFTINRTYASGHNIAAIYNVSVFN